MGQEAQGEEKEVPGQRKVLTTSSNLPASLLILLTTWPDPSPNYKCSCSSAVGQSHQGRVRMQSPGLQPQWILMQGVL